ncbi:MAG: hypothetical protein KUG77_13500 [Nannocystaceae bacterium]|nr:hypothetical protein [Nannocystaceae bacterium]
MSSLPRIVSVLLGIILAAPVAAPRTVLAQPSEMPGETADEATRLNAEAQRMFADGQYADAARTYARILEVLPENRVNLEERDNSLLIALEVYREAYRQLRVTGDKEATRRAAELLCTAEGHYETYLTTYREVYGGAMNPSKAALESSEELQKLLAEAETALGSPPCGPPPVVVDPKSQVLPPPPPPGPEPPQGPSGMGLIVAGALTLTAGLGASSMIVIGGINRRKARRVLDREESEDATEAEMMTLASEKKEARENRARANGLIIGGSVVTAVLLASGATMLGIGLRRRLRYMAFSPDVGRGYVGLSLQGRF